MIDEKELAKRMKLALKKDNLKQQLVAKEMGIVQSRLSDIVNNKVSATLAELNKFEEVTGEEMVTAKGNTQNNTNKDNAQLTNVQFVQLVINTNPDENNEKLAEQLKNFLEALPRK